MYFFFIFAGMIIDRQFNKRTFSLSLFFFSGHCYYIYCMIITKNNFVVWKRGTTLKKKKFHSSVKYSRCNTESEFTIIWAVGHPFLQETHSIMSSIVLLFLAYFPAEVPACLASNLLGF